MNARTQSESTALAVANPAQFDLSPRNFDEAWRMAEYLSDSDMVPKDFKGKPANCLVAIQWGAELNLKAMQAIQNIAIINGRPSLWGDVMLALVRASPLCEYVVEGWEADGTAWCKAKRRGEPEQIRTYSDADAKQAGLLGKQGPWTTGPKRMKQMRARGWALRDVFTDILRGLHMAEEALDMAPLPEKFMGAADVVGASPPAGPTFYSQEAFNKNLPAWLEAIKKGSKTADQVIATVESKAPLTEEQKKRIRGEQTTVAATPPPPPAQDGPVVTYAHVADLIAKAADKDALATAGDLIGEVADPQQRTELQALFDRREGELA